MGVPAVSMDRRAAAARQNFLPSIAWPSLRLQRRRGLRVDRVVDHLHRAVAEGHLEAVGVGAAEGPGVPTRACRARRQIPSVGGQSRDAVQRAMSMLSPISANSLSPPSPCGHIIVGVQSIFADQVRVGGAVGDVGHGDHAAAVDTPVPKLATAAKMAGAGGHLARSGFRPRRGWPARRPVGVAVGQPLVPMGRTSRADVIAAVAGVIAPATSAGVRQLTTCPRPALTGPRDRASPAAAWDSSARPAGSPSAASWALIFGEPVGLRAASPAPMSCSVCCSM